MAKMNPFAKMDKKDKKKKGGKAGAGYKFPPPKAGRKSTD